MIAWRPAVWSGGPEVLPHRVDRDELAWVYALRRLLAQDRKARLMGGGNGDEILRPVSEDVVGDCRRRLSGRR